MQFHRLFFVFGGARNKSAKIQNTKKKLTGNGTNTYGESRDRDERLRGTAA